MSAGLEFPVFRPVGDSAAGLWFEEIIDLRVNRRVLLLDRVLSENILEGIQEITPSYCSLLLHYDPLKLTYGQVVEWTGRFLGEGRAEEIGQGRLVEIPVTYGGRYGPDIESLAAFHKLTASQVVELHSGVEYRVYMMGFTPGFPYLGGLNPGIATPRLASPRTCVPAGSVGIAGMQTGIYPVDSPGGWQIIGHTPLILFDKDRRPPFLLCPGDRVRFIPIVEGEIADAA